MGGRFLYAVALLSICLFGFAHHRVQAEEPTIWFHSHHATMLEAGRLGERLRERYVSGKASINRLYVAHLHQRRQQLLRSWSPRDYLSGVAQSHNPGLANEEAREIADAIIDSSRRHDVDPYLVAALIAQESKFRPQVVSPGGAVGLGQLLPSTAGILGVDPFAPRQNVEGCVKYLKTQLNRWNGRVDLALASYNAGPGAVQKYGGVPPYSITRRYVYKINGRMETFRVAARKAKDRWLIANGPQMIDVNGRKVQTVTSSASEPERRASLSADFMNSGSNRSLSNT